MGCLLVGFTIAVAYVHTNRAAPTAAKVHNALVDRVRAAQASRAALETTAERLGDQVNQRRDAALSGSGGLRAELDRDQLLAGTTAATGPGLVVRLADPPAPSATPQAGRPGTVPIEASALLTDRDVRSVVNQLWSSGAEAISVNDVRLTPTSAIRFAGQAVLVDFQPITSPYTIRAIGDPDVLVTRFADSEVASRYHTLAARGVAFSFDESTKLTLPASAAVVAALCERGADCGSDPVIAALALVIGLVIGLVLRPTVPGWLEPYLPIAVVAALDAVFGGIRARLDGIFDAKVFVVSFVSNVVVAALIVFLGDKLGVGTQLSTAVVVVLGIRIFVNAAAIRRHVFHA